MSNSFCFIPPCNGIGNGFTYDNDGWSKAQVIGTAVGFSVAALIIIAIIIWRVILCCKKNRVNNAAPPYNNAGPNTNTFATNNTNYSDTYGGNPGTNPAYYTNAGGAAPVGGQDPYLAAGAAPPPNTYGVPVYGAPVVNEGGYGAGQYYAPAATNTPALSASPYPGAAPPPLYGGLPVPKYDQNTNYTAPGDPSGANYSVIAPLGTNPLAARSVAEDDVAKKLAQKEKAVNYVTTKRSDE